MDRTGKRQVRADRIKRGDWIECHGDGQPERVTFNQPYVSGRRAIRTSRHDHYALNSAKLTVVEAPDWSKR